VPKQTDNLFLIEEKKFENNKLIDVKEFDKRGNLTRHQDRIVLESRRKNSRDEEIYDNSGKLIRLRFYENEVLQPDERYYEYDDKGNLIKETFFYENRYGSEIRYFYDKNNRNIKRESYADEERRLSGIVYLEYDKHDNRTSLIARDETGHLRYKHYYQYRNKKLVGQTFFGGNGHLVWTTQLKYDKQNCVEANSYKRGILIHKIVTQYDENNNRASVQQFVHKKYYDDKWLITFFLR
jgi:hypothetical protein